MAKGGKYRVYRVKEKYHIFQNCNNFTENKLSLPARQPRYPIILTPFSSSATTHYFFP